MGLFYDLIRAGGAAACSALPFFIIFGKIKKLALGFTQNFQQTTCHFQYFFQTAAQNPFRWCIALDCSSKTVEMRARASFEKISSFDENLPENWKMRMDHQQEV